MKALAALTLLGLAQDAPSKEHALLRRFVGEWEAKLAREGGSGERAGVETARLLLGGYWVVLELRGLYEGRPYEGHGLLGYDPGKKMFIGTWVDSMQTHMWMYTGTLDEAKKILTLSAEGPSWEDPTKTARYRDAIEVVSPDVKTLTSSIEGPDGKWVQFMKAEYRRKK